MGSVRTQVTGLGVQGTASLKTVNHQYVHPASAFETQCRPTLDTGRSFFTVLQCRPTLTGHFPQQYQLYLSQHPITLESLSMPAHACYQVCTAVHGSWPMHGCPTPCPKASPELASDARWMEQLGHLLWHGAGNDDGSAHQVAGQPGNMGHCRVTSAGVEGCAHARPCQGDGKNPQACSSVRIRRAPKGKASLTSRNKHAHVCIPACLWACGCRMCVVCLCVLASACAWAGACLD